MVMMVSTGVWVRVGSYWVRGHIGIKGRVMARAPHLHRRDPARDLR